MIRLLVSISESDKRVILVICLLLVSFFALLGYIGFLVTRVMKHQGKQIDNYVFDVVTTRVITNKRHFRKYAHKKNLRLFFKQAQIPMLIMFISLMIILIRAFITKDFTYNVFNGKDGFGSALFLWEFDSSKYPIEAPLYQSFFGITIICRWPILMEVYGRPQFVLAAIPSYIFVPSMFVGIMWYLISVQAFIARFLHIRKLSNTVFDKSLDGFNQNQALYTSLGINANQNVISKTQENNQEKNI